MNRLRLALLIFTAGVGLTTSACTHELQVRNLARYSTPLRVSSSEVRPNVAVLPYRGGPDGIFYFNALVEQLSLSPSIGELETDYTPENGSAFRPDLVLAIDPIVDYRSSGWNFLINWPGFLIFTPAWNGYVYRADILTNVAMSDRNGSSLGSLNVPVTYNIRHAEMDRTIFAGLSWFEVSLLAFGGGIYNANVFDRDLIGGLQTQVKTNYTNYVFGQVEPKIRTAASGLRAVPAVASPGSE